MLLNEASILQIFDNQKKIIFFESRTILCDDLFYEKLKIQLDTIIETKFHEYRDEKDEKVKLTLCCIKNCLTSSLFKHNHLYIFSCVFNKKLLSDESYRFFNILIFFSDLKNDC